MKMKRLIIVVILVLIMGVAIFAIKRKKATLAKAKTLDEQSLPVSVIPVKKGDFVVVRRYIGIIEPLNKADISSRITADIVKVLYREGKLVMKGDLLIKLDNRNLLQAIIVLKAKAEGIKTEIVANNVNIKSLAYSVDYWEKQVKRDKQLFKKNVIPAKQVELSDKKLNEIHGQLEIASQKNNTFKAELTAIQGDIKIAETNLSYADITAPFDGVVCDAPVDPGDQAAPGKKMMIIENQHQFKVVIQLPQMDMKYINSRDKLKIQCRRIEVVAKISQIYPALGANRMIKVEAVLAPNNEKSFISGQYVKVSISTGTMNNVLIVPSASINIDNNKSSEKYVFILKNGVLQKLVVKVLGNNEIEAAVSGALKAGDQVVVSAYLGWARLADGVQAKKVN